MDIGTGIKNEPHQGCNPGAALTKTLCYKEQRIMANSSLLGKNFRSTQPIGARFGSLVVCGPPFPVSRWVKHSKRTELYVVCECDCGRVTSVGIHTLRNMKVCNTYCPNRKPKAKGPRVLGVLYQVWNGMKQRCYNPNVFAYKNYGGRGIVMCSEWRESYYAFEAWAFSNGWRKDLEIDRTDNDGNYEPSNCRFVTTSRNQRNRRSSRMETAFGETKCLADWGDDPRCLVEAKTLFSRMANGWAILKAMTTPKQNQTEKH